MTTKAYFKSLATLHGAMVTGLTIFSTIVWVLLHFHLSGNSNHAGAGSSSYDDVFFYVALSLVAASVVASYTLFRTRVAQVREKPTLGAILADYRSAILLRNALLEAPGLFAVIAGLATQNERLLALSGFIILMFLVWWPTKSKIIEALGLEGESRLDDPEAIID